MAISLVWLISLSVVIGGIHGKNNERTTTADIISSNGYPAETHTVITDDGYILTLHRLPRNKSNGSVLLTHGILGSSADWTLLGPTNGLAFILFDKGYDVWLSNVRGNRYSKNHTTLNVDSDKFWDFSWHEMGVFDLPATIDYILAKTDQEKIFHVGHSQGTTVFYVMCASKPEYNEKIRAHFSLSPVGFVSHMYSPLMRSLAKDEYFLASGLSLFNVHQFMAHDSFLTVMLQKICDVNKISEHICVNVLFTITGFNPKQMNVTMLPLVLSNIPAGSSVKQFLHYAQEIKSGKFAQFDHGWVGNWKRYSSAEPPDYNLKEIKAPLYIFYSKNDWISSDIDVARLTLELSSVKKKILVDDKMFNHMDYILAKEAPCLVYNKIVDLIANQ